MTFQHTSTIDTNVNGNSEKPAPESCKASGEVRLPRLHFNWGFHDGADAEKANRKAPWEGQVHPYPDYARGYEFGRGVVRETGRVPSTSAEAWNLHAALVEIEAMAEVDDSAARLWDLLDTAAAASAPLTFIAEVSKTAKKRNDIGGISSVDWAAVSSKIERVERQARTANEAADLMN